MKQKQVPSVSGIMKRKLNMMNANILLTPTSPTTTVGFSRSFVEGFGLHGQCFTLVHQVVKLLSTLQHRLNCVVLK